MALALSLAKCMAIFKSISNCFYVELLYGHNLFKFGTILADTYEVLYAV